MDEVGYGVYSVNGKELVTCEFLVTELAKEERSQRQADAMLWLTAVLAIAAAFQSGLIKTNYSSNVDWILGYAFELKQWMIEVIKTVAL